MSAVDDAPRCILFADVVGSTALYRQLGDTRAEALIRGALARVTALVQAQGGRLIKTIGDCAMCDLPSADAAALAAMEVQRVARQPPTAGDPAVLFRIGFMLGPVVDRDGDIFGDAVNVAARLCDMAKAEQILTTETSAETLSAALRGSVRLFDQTVIKGISESVRIVQLVWDRRGATEIFIVPDELAAPQVTRLMLRHAGQTLLIGAQQMPFTIGRELGCDWVVPSPFASRVHARIELHRGKFTLVDESTNGTYVAPEGAHGDQVIYIRREGFTLLGRGSFALGERPDQAGAIVLHYQLQ